MQAARWNTHPGDVSQSQCTENILRYQKNIGLHTSEIPINDNERILGSCYRVGVRETEGETERMAMPAKWYTGLPEVEQG